ncbi:hypothetical protein [Palleronia sp. LCG004]|uniref:hypothetical protein n=1 Tax=Palleronia sp. LCG004 TaxID=3079304 RepID=UPI002943E91B|nr:hypothetical protein [Palleronia sp. LCG004]WOI57269.1 hypothetical protein RVY76_05665 [Palleronia sp. LCG004]
MKRFPFISMIPLILAGCGGASEDVLVPHRFVIDTYLATPYPGQATYDAAAQRCLARGKGWQYVETRGNGRGGFRHVFECKRA